MNGFGSRPDRARGVSPPGAWRAALQLHLAQIAYDVQTFLLRVAGVLIALAIVYVAHKIG